MDDPSDRPVEALIFDMDGVLVNSVEHWTAVREAVIREELGTTDIDGTDLIGLSPDDEFDRLARNHDFQLTRAEYRARLEAHAEEIYSDRVDLLPGLPAVLELARDRGITLGLVSAARRSWIDLVLERFELAPFFDGIVGGDEVPGPSKPDPSIYHHAVEILGNDPGACVAVEDSAHGVASARGAGVYCIGYDHHPTEDLSAADEIVRSPRALVDRLRDICRA